MNNPLTIKQQADVWRQMSDPGSDWFLTVVAGLWFYISQISQNFNPKTQQPGSTDTQKAWVVKFAGSATQPDQTKVGAALTGNTDLILCKIATAQELLDLFANQQTATGDPVNQWILKNIVPD